MELIASNKRSCSLVRVLICPSSFIDDSWSSCWIRFRSSSESTEEEVSVSSSEVSISKLFICSSIAGSKLRLLISLEVTSSLTSFVLNGISMTDLLLLSLTFGILEVVSNHWRFTVGNWLCDSDLVGPTGIERVLTKKDLLAYSFSDLEASILDEKEFLLLKVISTLPELSCLICSMVGVGRGTDNVALSITHLSGRLKYTRPCPKLVSTVPIKESSNLLCLISLRHIRTAASMPKSIKGLMANGEVGMLSSLVTGAWGANTFPMRKQLLNPYFQNSQTFFLVFLTFSSNKCWWRLPHIFLFGRRSFGFSAALPSKGRLRQKAISTLRELSCLIYSMVGAGLGIEGVALFITHFSGRVTSSHFIVLGRETLAFVISTINKVVSPFCGLRRTLDAQVFMTLYWIL
ncbi:hypothetical protein HKD37_06G016500 [Glycine soja]